MKRFLYIMLYIALVASASAQRLRVGEQSSGMVRVTGRVTTLSPSSGGAGGGPKPVSDVIVKLISGTKTLAFTSTNAKGEYALEVKSAPSGEVTLQFTHISYEKESLALADLKSANSKSGISNPLQRKVDMMLTPKTESGKRIVTLPKSVYDELAQYIKDTDCAPDQRVFYFRQPGIWHEFRRCTAVAQLPPIRIHDIRHSHVSMLVDMGFNIKQIADRMGHRNASTTMKTYSHLYAGRDIELAKRLDNKILNLTDDDEDFSEGDAGEAENAKNDR